jgi:hypothetical protein
MIILHAHRPLDRQPSFRCRIAIGFGSALALPLAMLTISTSPAFAASVAHSRAIPAYSVPCLPTSTKIDGGPAIGYCGPATATMTIGGKSYSFKNGYCLSIKVADTLVDVTLGTIAEGKSGDGVPGNAGKPYFSLDLSRNPNEDILTEVEYGGKQLSDGAGILAKGTISASGSSKGTFKSEPGAEHPFSGSWNCHGVFVKS